MSLRVKVYPNPATAPSNKQDIAVFDLTNEIEGLKFGTSAFGGFDRCSFRLKKGLDSAVNMIYDYDDKGLIARRVVISAADGFVPYEGIIYTLSLELGGGTLSRTMETFYSAVRYDHISKKRGNPKTYTTTYDLASVNRYGIRVLQVDGNTISNANAAPASDIAARYLNTFSDMQPFDATLVGGNGSEIVTNVNCQGLASTLSFRYAFNNADNRQVDSSEVIKAMLTQGTNPSARYQWNERLPGPSGFLAYGQQFVSGVSSQIQNSGINVDVKEGQGGTRLDIIKGILKYGGTGQKRMLFQVWDKAGSTKGIASFAPVSLTCPYVAGYSGYYYSLVENRIFDSSRNVIPFWKVRAGNWMTLLDGRLIRPSVSGSLSIYKDPRCFWIETTSYDVDRREMSLETTIDFDIRTLMGGRARDWGVVLSEYHV